MNHPPLLDIKNLRTYFHVKAGTVKAVDGIDLNLGSGVKLGLVGESGSGKTTVALSIMRQVRPPGTIEGEIRLEGVDLLKLSNEDMRKIRLSQISYMPQGAMNSLNPVARIKAQIVDGMIDHGVQFGSRDEERRQVTELLEVAELPARVANMYPHELSGGMKQRVCLAIAIALHPKLLIADESMAGLSQSEVDDIVGLLIRLNERGITIIMIEHIMRAVMKFSQRLVVLVSGKKIADGKPDQVIRAPEVERAYLGQ